MMRMISRKLNVIAPIFLIIISVVTLYVMNYSYFLLAKPLDIRWLNQIANPFVAKDSIAFSCINWFFTQFSLSPIDSIKASVLLILILLSLTTFYLLRKVSGDYLSSFLAAFLAILFPSHIWLICTSNYHVLFGLSLISLAFLFVYESNKEPLKKATLALIFGLLISFTDILSSLTFFLSSFIYWLMLIISQRGISLENSYPLFSAISLVSLIFARIHIIEPLVAPLPIVIGVLMSILSMFLLFKEKRGLIICAWFLSSILIAILTRSPLIFLYTALPAIVLSFTLFAKYLRKAIVISEEEEEFHVEIDLLKLGGLILIALLFVSALISTYNVLNSVAFEMKIYSDKYGYEDLLEVLDWIRNYTPEETVILSEYPLCTWIKSYTGRPVIGNYPVNFYDDMKEFLRCYDADTILNSNFEIRNRLMRLRDWEPVAPQRSPLFASSKENKYFDFLYIDENHANVKYSFEGKTLKPSFYEYRKKNTTWLIKSAEEAALQHTYVLEGNVTIVKRLFLGKSSESIIEYNITSTESKIESFSIKMWIVKERKIGFTQISGNRFYFVLDSGEYVVEFQGKLKSLSFGPDEVWFQNRVLATFEPEDNQVQVRIIVRVLNGEPLAWMEDEVFSTSAWDLLVKHRVGYAVIPTIVKKIYMDRFGLDDLLFKSQYENSKLTIYMVRA